MVKTCTRSFLLLILLAAFSATGFSQSAKSIIDTAAKALGAENIATLHYSGSGSTYVPAADPKAQWTHRVMKSYTRDIQLGSGSSSLQMVNVLEGKEQPTTVKTQPGSPWTDHYDYWMTPYSFLKGAQAHNATAEDKSLFGTSYKVLTFTPEDNHSVVGYINAENTVYKVESKVGDTMIETFFHDYEDFDGLKFPTTIIQKTGGQLSMVLIVKEVKKGGV